MEKTISWIYFQRTEKDISRNLGKIKTFDLFLKGRKRQIKNKDLVETGPKDRKRQRKNRDIGSLPKGVKEAEEELRSFRPQHC